MTRVDLRRLAIVFVWDNFGPLHADRADAVAIAVAHAPVIGLELSRKSIDYDWISETGTHFEKVTLSNKPLRRSCLAWRLVCTLARLRPRAVFFCHYERLEILLAAWFCRLVGVRAFTMNDSKFDDYERILWREVLKRFFLLPYAGALVASRRSADYLRFLGVPADRIVLGYDTVPQARIRRMAAAPPAPGGPPFEDRHFTIVARLVPKKNISTALRAFSVAKARGNSRRLVICGSGPLEYQLRKEAEQLCLGGAVEFRGFVQSEAVARVLANTLALILPSTEEQFGQVIAEAVVMGVPVLVSDNCGARDLLVRTAVNGFIFEPDNVGGLARLMDLIASDKAFWTELSRGADHFIDKADVECFVHGAVRLIELSKA